MSWAGTVAATALAALPLPVARFTARRRQGPGESYLQIVAPWTGAALEADVRARAEAAGGKAELRLGGVLMEWAWIDYWAADVGARQASLTVSGHRVQTYTPTARSVGAPAQVVTAATGTRWQLPWTAEAAAVNPGDTVTDATSGATLTVASVGWTVDPRRATIDLADR